MHRLSVCPWKAECKALQPITKAIYPGVNTTGHNKAQSNRPQKDCSAPVDKVSKVIQQLTVVLRHQIIPAK